MPLVNPYQNGHGAMQHCLIALKQKIRQKFGLPVRLYSHLDCDNLLMAIFTRQTLRSFAVGFTLGALAIAATVGHDRMPNLSDQVVPQAIAATPQ